MENRQLVNSTTCGVASLLNSKRRHQTSTVKRFGEYAVNLSRPPESWIKEVAVQFKPGNSQPATLPLVEEARP
jgi:hypothetical protein